MKPQTEQCENFTVIYGDLLTRAKQQGLDAKDLAQRLSLAPETLSRMKGRCNGDFATLDALARLVGMRLALVPDNEIADSIRSGEFF